MRRMLTLVVSIAITAACGGDDNSSSGVHTGLPSEQKLSTLDEQEVKQACLRVNDAANMVITPEVLERVGCLSTGVQAGLTVSGSQATVDVAKCQQAVDTCVSNAAAQGTEKDPYMCEDASAMDVNNCDATVGDYETCLSVLLDKMQERLDLLKCQNAEKLSSSDYSEAELDPKNIPQCQTLMTKCPDAQLGLPSFDSAP